VIIQIGYKQCRIFTADGAVMPAREILTQQFGEIRAVQCFEEFEDLKEVRFVFSFWFLRFEIPVDDGVQNAVINHLRLYHAKRDLSYDCYAFANTVRGVPPHKVEWMRRYWDTSLLKGRPGRGDVVFLVNKEDTTFHHAAIYLDMGLYLSVWGAGGDIEVATLNDMKIGFSTDTVYLVTPRGCH
jgi:hypothetical protein